jgi:transposase
MADFFSKARDSVRKGMSTATTKSKELVETQRLKGQISKLAEERKAALQELGSLVFEMSERGDFDRDAIRTKCEAITGIGERTKEYEKQLEEVHQKAQEAAEKSKMA